MNTAVPAKDGTSRLVKVAVMLFLPLLLAAVVACDNTGSSAEPYASSPEGKPPVLGNPVPDPAEQLETLPAGQLPSFLSQAGATLGPKIKAQYQGAVDNYDAYSHVPCYCGCAVYTHAHTSLVECFIKEKKADGTLTFTDHSMSCDICQGIAQMTIDGVAANKPVKDIRADVFTKYKYTQIWTDTPPVP